MDINRNDPCPCGSGKKYKKCCLDNALKVTPNTSPRVSINIKSLIDEAFSLHQKGALIEATEAYAHILSLDPTNAEVLFLLGTAHFQQENFDSAIPLLEQAVKQQGPHRDFLYNLANALRGARRDKEAISVYQQILDKTPHDVDVLNNLGLTYRNLNQKREAYACFETGLKHAPRDTALMSNFGLALYEMNRVDEAIAVYQQALKINPNLPEVCNNLGPALQQTGDAGGAYTVLRQALALQPDYPVAHSNLIFCLDFMEEGGAARQQDERRRWAARFAANIPAYTTFNSTPEPGRKLRIGYVSADFRRHSAAYAFGPLLLEYDRNAFEVSCFSNSTTNDELTQRFRASVDQWHDIYALSDNDVAALIHDLGIDILVDLSSHSRDNRLRVMARRPAPVQVTGWGHANGTGLATVDYLFADAIYIPPADAVHYTEKLRYLPCTLGYLTQSEAPAYAPLPALKNGHITFGSFSRLSKVNTATLDMWCELMRVLPNSQIVIKAPELNSPSRQQQLLAHFTQAGINAARISLYGGTPWYEHLQTMNQVDIALDPFPHGGGITVFDCLWMGLPVLAVNSSIATGRLAASVLHAVGLPDWVAERPADLIPLALQKCSDVQLLAKLRAGLREQMGGTVVGNPRRYTQAVEQHYRDIWQTWCQSQETNSIPRPAPAAP